MSGSSELLTEPNLKNWDDRDWEKDKSQKFLSCCHTGFSQAITSYFANLSPSHTDVILSHHTEEDDATNPK